MKAFLHLFRASLSLGRRYFLPLAIFVLSIFRPVRGNAQNISNEGTDFYAVFPTHIPATQAAGGVQTSLFAEYSLFITGKQNSSVTVTVGLASQTYSITANQVTEVPVNRLQSYITNDEAGSVLSNRAIHIKVAPGQPKVVVYGHIFAGRRAAASLILPIEAMGQKYFTLNFDNNTPRPEQGGQNFIVVVATEADTKVLVRRRGTNLITGGINLKKPGDAYEFLSSEDLTGVEIIADPTTSACKRFAVFSGSTNVLITAGCNSGDSSDPLYQQNYPVDSWGTTYGFVPFFSTSSLRSRGSIFRVLAKDNNTKISLNGAPLVTLNSGEFFTSAASTTPGLITADHPIAVAQYALSQACAGGGVSDPDMVILNPVEYNINNITVYSSSREFISAQYLNIFIPSAAAPSFRINGSLPAESFTALGATGYSYAKLALDKLNTNNFVLSATEGFNAIAYGFGDHESYAYSAGTSLASSQVLTAVRTTDQQELKNACVQEDFRFKLLLPDIATKLTWQFGSDTPFDQSNPSFTPVDRNGATFYEYFFPKTSAFDKAVTLPVKVLALYSPGSSCYTSEQEINFLFEVYDPPSAAFSAPASACANENIAFTDQSVSGNKPVSGWMWDFGDGSTSSLQNPVHSFAAGGSYDVKLTVSNGTGCASQVVSHTVKINGAPVAAFTFAGNGCANNVVKFSDASDSGTGSVVRWAWDFGDGSTSEEQYPSHLFLKTGTYQVKLKVTSVAGCSSAITTVPVTVTAVSLDAGPDRVILKGGKITLKIQADGTDLSYKWSPATGLDRTDIANPVASPSADTRYTVTVTSAEGCTLTGDVEVKVVQDFFIPNTFTPNADGVNDTWNLQYLDTYPEVLVKIYNRYGTTVFASVGYPVPWDGRSGGQDLPVGTYYYIISTKDKKPFSGSVTIVR